MNFLRWFCAPLAARLLFLHVTAASDVRRWHFR